MQMHWRKHLSLQWDRDTFLLIIPLEHLRKHTLVQNPRRSLESRLERDRIGRIPMKALMLFPSAKCCNAISAMVFLHCAEVTMVSDALLLRCVVQQHCELELVQEGPMLPHRECLILFAYCLHLIHDMTSKQSFSPSWYHQSSAR